MHADGQVMHDAQRHSRAHRLRLRRRQLLVELPLHPAVEVDRRLMLSDELRDACGRGMLNGLRPAVPIAAVLLSQRAPRREVVEGATFTLEEGGVGQLAARRPGYPVQQLE